MAFSSFNLAVPPAPCTGKQAHSRRPLTKAVGPAFQIRCRKVQDSPQPFMVSRRDAMVCLTSSLASVFYATSPAEAQPLNLDIGQIFKEKLDMLLEKAGLAKKLEPSPPTAEEKSLPGHQFMEQVEILKEKVGLSKDSSPPAEENPTPGSLVMEKFETFKTKKVGLSTNDDSSLLAEEEVASSVVALGVGKSSNMLLG